jgi:hypothetical protein
MNHLQVGFFIVAANVINFTGLTFAQNGHESPAVVLNIEPIPYILPVVVNRKRFVVKGIQNH